MQLVQQEQAVTLHVCALLNASCAALFCRTTHTNTNTTQAPAAVEPVEAIVQEDDELQERLNAMRTT